MFSFGDVRICKLDVLLLFSFIGIFFLNAPAKSRFAVTVVEDGLKITDPAYLIFAFDSLS